MRLSFSSAFDLLVLTVVLMQIKFYFLPVFVSALIESFVSSSMTCIVDLFIFTISSSLGFLNDFSNFHPTVGRFGLQARITRINWTGCDVLANIYAPDVVRGEIFFLTTDTNFALGNTSTILIITTLYCWIELSPSIMGF